MEAKKIEITAIVMQKTFIPGDDLGHIIGVDARLNRTYPHTRYLIRDLNNNFYAWDAYNRHDLSVNGVYRLTGSIKKDDEQLIELTRCKINIHLTKGNEL